MLIFVAEQNTKKYRKMVDSLHENEKNLLFSEFFAPKLVYCNIDEFRWLDFQLLF